MSAIIGQIAPTCPKCGANLTESRYPTRTLCECPTYACGVSVTIPHWDATTPPEDIEQRIAGRFLDLELRFSLELIALEKRLSALERKTPRRTA